MSSRQPRARPPGIRWSLRSRRLVAPAHHHGDEPPTPGDGAERLGHRPDTPGAGHDEDRPVGRFEAEGRPGRFPVLGSGEAGRHHGTGRDGRAPAPRRRLQRRARVHGEVQVEARVDPQRMDTEIGDEVDDGHGELARAPQLAEHGRRQGIGGHDDVGAVLRRPLLHLAAGRPGQGLGQRRAQEGQEIPQAVGQVIGPRHVAHLELVATPDHAPHVQWGGQHEVPHLGVVPVGPEPGDQLARGSVMPGPHAGRNDEHPGSHDGQG